MMLTQVLIDEAEATYDVLERLFSQVNDEDLLWMPSEGHNWMTMGQLLMHCASFGCGKAVQGFVTGSWPGEAHTEASDIHLPPATMLPAVASVRQALELLSQDRQLTATSIAAVRDEDLATQRIVAPWGGRELWLFEQVLEMIKHLTQHKGQLFYYLKLMGKDVDSHDLWGA